MDYWREVWSRDGVAWLVSTYHVKGDVVELVAEERRDGRAMPLFHWNIWPRGTQ